MAESTTERIVRARSALRNRPIVQRWLQKALESGFDIAHPLNLSTLQMSDICKQKDVQYHYGDKTVTFTACVLF